MPYEFDAPVQVDTDEDIEDIASETPSEGDILYYKTDGTRYNKTPSVSFGRGLLNIGTAGALAAVVVGSLISDSITNGVTNVAPSQNAVFDALALKADLASPSFTGVPTAPTAGGGTNTTQIATTAFVTSAVAALSSVYQPLDSDLTAWAAVNPSSYSTTAQIAAAYQPLNANLTEWATINPDASWHTPLASALGSGIASFLAATKPTTVVGYGLTDGVRVVATKAALRAIDTSGLAAGYTVRTIGNAAINDYNGGVWRFVEGDTSSFITSDPAGTRYVAPNSSPTGVSGCWDLIIDQRSRIGDTAAVGDYSTDDTTAIQAAGSLIGSQGGALRLGTSKRYLLTENGNNNYCLNYTNFISIEGQGLFSALAPKSDVASDVSTLKLTGGSYNQVFRQFTIGNPNNGANYGGVGIEIDATATSTVIPYWLFDHVVVFGTGNDVALKFTNNATNNPNGAGFLWEFRGGLYNGGIEVIEGGDSWAFYGVQLTGENVGLDWTGVNGGGGNPTQCIMFGANTTSDGGAAAFHSGHFCQVYNSNTEQLVSGPSYIYDFAFDVVDSLAPALRNSLVTAGAGVAVTAHTRFDNCFGGVCEGNAFLIGDGSAATGEIVIGSGCVDFYWGPNIVGRAGGAVITDSGVGTRGVTKVPSLLNSWVDFGSGYEGLSYMKDRDGVVHVWGTIKNGTTTGGTDICVLPSGFRPAAHARRSVVVSDGGVTIGLIDVLSDGTMEVAYLAGNAIVVVDFSFRAALGNSLLAA